MASAGLQPEKGGGGVVPEHDRSARIGDHDGVGELMDELGELITSDGGSDVGLAEEVGVARGLATLVGGAHSGAIPCA